jgi:hypothetical protein
MDFESILDTTGTVYNNIAGSIMGVIEKLAPGLAAWLQGLVDVINSSGNAKALALLAIVGLVLGFIFCTIKIFSFGNDWCREL